MPEPGWGVDAHGRAYRLDGLVVCDFCLGPGPTWEFPAAPMPIVGHATIGASDDEWAACDECAALVTASRLGELVERCVQRQRELYPTDRPAQALAVGAPRLPGEPPAVPGRPHRPAAAVLERLSVQPRTVQAVLSSRGGRRFRRTVR
jgi:hypothetical protein